MTATLLQAVSGNSGREAVVRFSGLGAVLASGDTLGITVAGDTFLYTAPAAGASLQEAVQGLSELIIADVDYGAAQAVNSPDDVCLTVQGQGTTKVTLTLPVFVVA